jgi:hypothetical protein
MTVLDETDSEVCVPNTYCNVLCCPTCMAPKDSLHRCELCGEYLDLYFCAVCETPTFRFCKEALELTNELFEEMFLDDILEKCEGREDRFYSTSVKMRRRPEYQQALIECEERAYRIVTRRLP